MNAGKVLCFNVTRKLVVQYKKFLDILGELHADKDDHAHRLYEALEEIEQKLYEEQGISISITQHLKQSDWLDEKKLSRLRKRILDLGNDLKREVETEMDQYDIDFKK